MATLQKALRLRIYHGGKVSEHHVMPHEIFTIGRSPDNNLTLYGEEYPKQQILFSWKNNATFLHVPTFANGEVRLQNSTLVLRDLYQHRILASHNGAMLLPLFDGKVGYVMLSPSIRVEFCFDGVVRRPDFSSFKGFSWPHVMLKELTQDIYFKFIFIFFLLLNALVLYAYKDIKIEKPKTC